MKIDTHTISLSTPQKPLKSEAEGTFDLWLDAPVMERHADDYYWQHLDQLQQSALTFEPLINPLHKQLTLGDDELIQLKTPPPSTEVETTSQQAENPFKFEETDSTTLPQQDVLTLISSIETPLSQLGLSAEHEITRLPITQQENPRPVRYSATMPTNSLFKNYQLFLNDHAIELTLNTAQLSQQDAIALQKLIQQWINHKGYSLKQLILNGVLQ